MTLRQRKGVFCRPAGIRLAVFTGESWVPVRCGWRPFGVRMLVSLTKSLTRGDRKPLNTRDLWINRTRSSPDLLCGLCFTMAIHRP
jgi:hypothetical protein